MTYERIKKSIISAWNTTLYREKEQENCSPYKVFVNINPTVNHWNRVAIELSGENEKIPSRRHKILCYPTALKSEHNLKVHMTTNEWNSMALGMDFSNNKITNPNESMHMDRKSLAKKSLS